MKLAEALIQRADTQKRIQELRKRLNRNARVQEGDQPTEEPLALLHEIDELTETLVELIQRINRTNAASEITAGKSISDALAERDILATRQKVYRELAGEATSGGQGHFRLTRSEIKFQSTVDVADIQRRADLLAKEYRELDTRLQELNWQVELLD